MVPWMGQQEVSAPLVRYRNHLKIVADILTVAEKGVTKTEIMYKANLSYEMLQNYLDALFLHGLISHSESTYKITSMGLEFLRDFEEFRNAEELSLKKKSSLNKMLGK